MVEYLDSQTPVFSSGDLTVGDFWRWAYSDILSNRNRGIFAEFLVGAALKTPPVVYAARNIPGTCLHKLDT